MTDLDARAARVRSIAESNHGRVIGRDGDTMIVEVPADVASGLGAMRGESGINPVFIGCDTRQAKSGACSTPKATRLSVTATR